LNPRVIDMPKHCSQVGLVMGVALTFADAVAEGALPPAGAAKPGEETETASSSPVTIEVARMDSISSKKTMS
jgi:hypothetical protein